MTTYDNKTSKWVNTVTNEYIYFDLAYWSKVCVWAEERSLRIICGRDSYDNDSWPHLESKNKENYGVPFRLIHDIPTVGWPMGKWNELVPNTDRRWRYMTLHEAK